MNIFLQTQIPPLQFVHCTSGIFYMGSLEGAINIDESDECPRHLVDIPYDFWIGKYPITHEQWEFIMRQEPRLSPKTPTQPNFPALGMGWDEAMIFVQKLNQLLLIYGLLPNDCLLTLPTEAEWEYACRANTETLYHFGDDATVLDKYGWFYSNSGDMQHPVGQKLPNPLGIYDLYGNVEEWCLNSLKLYRNFTTFPRHGGKWDNHSDMKIIRGGSFASLSQDCRSASRRAIFIDNGYNEETGLRLVLKRQSDIYPPND